MVKLGGAPLDKADIGKIVPDHEVLTAAAARRFRTALVRIAGGDSRADPHRAPAGRLAPRLAEPDRSQLFRNRHRVCPHRSR